MQSAARPRNEVGVRDVGDHRRHELVGDVDALAPADGPPGDV